MAFSPHPQSTEGYATPVALVLSIALAIISTAIMTRSIAQLKLARADFDRTQAEYVLDGAHLAAASAIVRSNREGPYKWAFTSDVGWVDALAEVEANKLSLKAASNLHEADLLRFGVTNVAQLKARLAQAASTTQFVDVTTLDDAPLWQACSRSMISPLGKEDVFTYVRPAEPGPGPKPASWRIGEVWRIRLTTLAGWRDDRIVRFTGDARHPAAVLVRQMKRGEGDGGKCDEILTSVAAPPDETTATP